jgi:hypothetical protein
MSTPAETGKTSLKVPGIAKLAGDPAKGKTTVLRK